MALLVLAYAGEIRVLKFLFLAIRYTPDPSALPATACSVQTRRLSETLEAVCFISAPPRVAVPLVRLAREATVAQVLLNQLWDQFLLREYWRLEQCVDEGCNR